MAWEYKTVEDQRKKLVEAYLNGSASMSKLCESFGISRKCGHKWVNRYLEEGEEGLKDLSRAPHQPQKIYSNHILSLAIDFKLKHRDWGPKKILVKLKELYPRIEWPSPTRLYEIYKEHHLVNSKKVRNRVPVTHPLGEVNASNEVWSADFKGWFLTKDGKKCEPLTITDGYSRYLIRCEHLDRKTAHDVWPVFESAFREYGLPLRIRTDNGPPFGSTGVGRLTYLSINFIKAGIMPEWINPGHPEENGRHERFHLTLKNAVANPPAENLREQQVRMAKFQEEYNFYRPHEALNMNSPSAHYMKSNKIWDGKLKTPEYDTGMMSVRKVGVNGCIWIKQANIYVSDGLAGEYLGLKEKENGFEVYYGNVHLGEVARDSLKIARIKTRERKS